MWIWVGARVIEFTFRYNFLCVCGGGRLVLDIIVCAAVRVYLCMSAGEPVQVVYAYNIHTSN